MIWLIAYLAIRGTRSAAPEFRTLPPGAIALMVAMIYLVTCAATRRLNELSLPTSLALLIAAGMVVLSLDRGWLVAPVWAVIPCAAAITLLHCILCFKPPALARQT
ncbi:hypothetical protein [Paludibaculum fermentans]|uniref:hypothetical protein n=1 Tax=Paludibaculum fermentans TaxID=1473598 RepID=UPI003EBE6C97